MICALCGCTAFSATEYTVQGRLECRAPALSCDECGAITLKIEAARSDADRDSIRLAIALRADARAEARRQ